MISFTLNFLHVRNYYDLTHKGKRNTLLDFLLHKTAIAGSPSVLPRRNGSLAFLFFVHSPHHGPFLLGVQALKVVFADCPAVVFPFSRAIIKSDELFGFLMDAEEYDMTSNST